MVFRKCIWFPVVLLAVPALLMAPAGAQTKALSNTDVSADGFYQFTSNASGNGITDTASKSAGGAAFLRHSYHWWLGWEAGYAYTRFTEFYTGQPFGYQHNLHEFAGSYYVHGPRALGIQPFATVGGSALLFSPTLNGGQNVPYQVRPGLNYGVGVNVPLLTSHLGLRLQYRGLMYKAPNFGEAYLTTNAWRETSEPMAGVYIRF